MAKIIEVVQSGDLSPVLLSSWLDGMPPRDALFNLMIDYPGSDGLTVARNVIDCRGYIYQETPFPGSSILINTTNSAMNGIPPLKQVDGTINVAPGSMLVSLACTSLQPEGFDYRIFDQATLMDFHYGEFISNYTKGESRSYPDSLILGPSEDQMLMNSYFFPTPVVITGSGRLSVSVVNRSENYNVCQVSFRFAVPGSYTNVAMAAVDLEY